VPVKSIDPTTLQQWLAQGSAMLVDVREPAEYRAGHIAQAHHIPLARIDATRLPGSDGPIVVHCLKGARGASACEKLLRQNPNLEIYNLEGGIDAWSAAGLPIKGEGGFALPLDRQVQLTIGVILLVAAALTFFINPLFILVSVVMGMGLTFAGATGFCGLARVMARAPWNQ